MLFARKSCSSDRAPRFSSLVCACLLAGCSTPPASFAVGGTVFVIERTLEAPAPLPIKTTNVTAVQPPSVDASASTSEASPRAVGSSSAPTAIVSASGGGGLAGGSGGGGATPTPGPASFFINADGTQSNAVVADAVPLPVIQVGEVSLIAAGRVPSSLVLGGGMVPSVTHPRPDALVNPFPGLGTLTGLPAPALGGLAVRFIGADRSTFTSTLSPATVPFTLNVPVVAATQGLVVITEPIARPRLGVVSANPAPGATQDLGAIPLVSPGADQAPPPLAPPGLAITGAELRLADAGGAGVALPIFAIESATLPSYALPGTFQLAYKAANADSTQASEVCGPIGLIPAFLVPPDASAIANPLVAGQTLVWPAVPGATLYTLRLLGASIPDPPLWEGATASPSIVLPRQLVLAGKRLTLHLDAWDATGVSVFSVASLRAPRQLRLPTDPIAVTGRHAAAIRVLAGG
jgi:hypothetical protein